MNSSSWNNAYKLFCFLPHNEMFLFCCGLVTGCTLHGNHLGKYTVHIVSLNHYICLSIWVVCYCIKLSGLYWLSFCRELFSFYHLSEVSSFVETRVDYSHFWKIMCGSDLWLLKFVLSSNLILVSHFHSYESWRTAAHSLWHLRTCSDQAA